jgi:hypothetical protein
VAIVTIVTVPALFSQEPLFSQPLHLVRRVEDPISGKTETIDEYYAGNRVVTLSGRRVAIADYDLQQLTEIDRGTATYSVTRFEEIAKARQQLKTPAPRAASWKVTPLGVRSSAAGTSADTFEIDDGGTREHRRIQVGFDRRFVVSRAAAEVLLGAAYPNAHRDEHDQILGVAAGQPAGGRIASASAGAPAYALPVEQTMTIESEGQSLTVHNSVIRIDNGVPPTQALLIEPGLRQVESRLTRLGRELHELDTIPSTKSQR